MAAYALAGHVPLNKTHARYRGGGLGRGANLHEAAPGLAVTVGHIWARAYPLSAKAGAAP